MLQVDIIANPAKYIIDDSPTELHSDSTNSLELLRKGSLCWNLTDSKMYVYLDTDDRDNVDMTAEDFTSAKYEYVIGRLPNSWFNRIDSGLPMAMNFNLVDVNDGGSLIPSSTSTGSDYVRGASKSNGVDAKHIYLKPAYDWTTTSDRVCDNVTNEFKDDPLNYMYSQNRVVNIYSYTAQPKPTTQADPKQTILTPSKCLVSNSHSWYQGGGITNAVTGKVSVSDESKTFESLGLEDVNFNDVDFIEVITPDKILTVINTNSYLFLGFNTIGGVFKRVGSTTIGYNQPSTFNADTSIAWERESMQTTPKHTPINLSQSDSPTSKAFASLVVDDNNEICLALTGEEEIWDTSHDADDVVVYTAGDGEVTFTSGSLIKPKGFDNSTFNDTIFQITEGKTIDWVASSLDNYRISDGLVYDGDTQIPNASVWSGNGFGDSGEFEQLTNGVILDVNGNSVRTYNGIQRTGCYLNEEDL